MSGLKSRRLLAALGALPQQAVSVEALVDAVWDHDPPATARKQIQNTISALRATVLGPALTGRGGGYLLDVARDQVDISRFDDFLSAADEAERVGDVSRMAQVLRAGLDVWRGPAFADVTGRRIQALAARLQQRRFSALTRWAKAALDLGQHACVVDELTAWDEHVSMPEPLTGALMLALYRCGREAEAIACYHRTRRALADELGVEPGQELRQLFERMITGDPALAFPPHQAQSPPDPPVADDRMGDGTGGTVPPRQLPRDATSFTGRGVELERVLSAVSEGMVVISAIDGMAGVGKTALAVHAAHRLAGRFPDGQLFVDLHGFTVGVERVEPADALERLLRDVGVAGERIPAKLDDRAALWRSVLAGRRMLIVLDNAATEAQVLPLLPGAGECLVLVTSRRRLTALEATHTVSLDMLPPPDAAQLFVHTADRPELTVETPEVVEAVQWCGRLPLAIRIAAARLRHRPVWTVADLVARLRQVDARLAVLDDGRRSIHAALQLSYQHLPADAQHLYRLLTLHPGPDFDAYAATALASGGLDEVQRWLDGLVDDHLLAEPVPGRYRFHDLVRAHAAALGTREETPARQRAALGCLLDHYRRTASTAMDVAYPYERQLRPEAPPAGTPAPNLSDRDRAHLWLDTELATLLAAAHHAAQRGLPEHTWQLSAVIDRHLRTRGRYGDAETLHLHALSLARDAGNHAAELNALKGLAYVHRVLGNYGLAGLGSVNWMLGRHERAAHDLGRALRIASAIGDRGGQLKALNGLGHVHRVQGNHRQAADCYQQVFNLAHELGSGNWQFEALQGLGRLHRATGHPDLALTHHQQALQHAIDLAQPPDQARAHDGLAHAHHALGRHDQARRHWQHAMNILTGLGTDHTEDIEASVPNIRAHLTKLDDNR